MDKTNIIKNATLGMIVANEESNCAGGIYRTVHNHLPHYEQGVIVHTGSIDGTGEVLKQLEREFPNLRVIYNSEEFQKYGWAGAKNVVLKSVQTRRVSFFDADEVIKEKDYETLAEFVNSNCSWGFNFRCIRVSPDGIEIAQEQEGFLTVQNPRIFRMTRKPIFGFLDESGAEWLYARVNKKDIMASEDSKLCIQSPVPFYHFKPHILSEWTEESLKTQHLCRDRYN